MEYQNIKKKKIGPKVVPNILGTRKDNKHLVLN